MTAFLSLALAVAFVPLSAPAAEATNETGDGLAPLTAQAADDIASGTWGTCPWEISADGTLTVHPGIGADTSYASPWEGYENKIVNIVFKAEGNNKVIAPVDCSSLVGFDYDNMIRSIDLSGLDTSRTVNMSVMFQHCSSLTSIFLSHLDTSNVEEMSLMFYRCHSLASLDLSSFDTSNLKDMSFMFQYCESLTSLDLSSLDTTNVMDMLHGAAGPAFIGTPSLASVKVGPKTLVNLELPENDVNGHADWYSKGAGTWLTAQQISAQRKGIADTYLKQEATPDPGTSDPGTPDPGTADPGTPDLGAADPEPDDPGTTSSGTDAAKPADTQRMLRLYNPNSGEHFYTADENEKRELASLGWKDEGIGWVAPKEGVAVYRLYNAVGGEHHYTTSEVEKDALVGAGWIDEGIGWRSDPERSVALHRLYNPNAFSNNHHYTTDEGEKAVLLGFGWLDEGVGWHGVN